MPVGSPSSGLTCHFSVSVQLQHLVSDEVCLQVAELYLAERKRGAAGGNLSSQCVRAAWETSYQWKSERVMAEENCFKVTTCPGVTNAEPFSLEYLIFSIDSVLEHGETPRVYLLFG